MTNKSMCFFLSLLNTYTCFASHLFFKNLEDHKRFGDLYHLSLQGMNTNDLSKANLHRRNAARVSLQIGDFESSLFFLRENIHTSLYQENNISPEKFLLAYHYLLLDDLSMWEKFYMELDSNDRKRMLILQAIDGPASVDVLNQFKLLEFDKELDVETRITVQNYLNCSQKSPLFAGVLSLFFPGGGYAYLGMWQTAALSFLLTGLCGLSAREQFLDHKPLTGSALAVLGSVFYLGGAFGAVRSAQDINQKTTSEPRHKLRNFAFPELKMEWEF